MADIELVIKINREQYSLIMQSHRSGVARLIDKEAMMYAIKNGTPLPKGHGRLIDENKLLENLKESANHHANNSREESLLYRDRVIVREQPTIIEAESEDK